VDEIIGEMILLLRGEANEHAVSIRTDLAADLPEITADRVQPQQILMNLMLNGIEAIKDTGGVVTVKSQLGEDGQIEISVNDTGSGLPLGKADQIFDAFFTTKPHGSGMGLAISKSIVESHGGRIFGPTATAAVALRSTSPCRRHPRKQTLPWMPSDSAFSRVGRRAQSASFDA
jgi:signal transduction histidine kinase